MAYEVKGVVHQIDQEQTFASGFTKRMIVIKTDEKYAQTVPIEFFKDDVIKVEKLKLGQEVTVHFNLKGNYYEPKKSYFTTLQGWKIETNQQAPKSNVDTFIDEEMESPF
jgi:single-strand DNA-binding protein